MQNSDRQLQQIFSRAEKVKKARRIRRLIWSDVCACCLLFALLAATVLRLPKMTAQTSPQENTLYGSLILSSPILSYLMVALLAFALGICVTLLCLLLRRRKGRENK